ncbi:MAG: ZIP family metal transporter [Actinomycetota bacterium]
MSRAWILSLVSVAAVSSLSLLGGLTLMLKPQVVRRALLPLISFAAGGLLGDAFLHLIPEAASNSGLGLRASFSLLGGLVGFFVLEKVLHWHHAHLPSKEVLHPVAVTNLIGDGLHNFVDGAIIAGSFLNSPELGLATALAVALHELPQELGDFSILIHAGLKPKRALALNLISALAAAAGAVATLALSSAVGRIESYLIPLTAGGFVYIASTDLIPELHKEPEASKSVAQLAALLAGVAVMAALRWLD